MRLGYSLMLFAICLNFSAYLLPLFLALPSYAPESRSPTDISNLFSIEKFAAFLAVSAATGLIAVLFRQGTYAIYAILAWAVGIFMPIISDFVLAIPNLVNKILPPETNPLASQGLPNPISLVVNAILGFAFFMFLMELVSQRNLT